MVGSFMVNEVIGYPFIYICVVVHVCYDFCYYRHGDWQISPLCAPVGMPSSQYGVVCPMWICGMGLGWV